MGRRYGAVALAIAIAGTTISCSVDRLIKPGGARTYSPNAPVSLSQYRSDGITAIAAGDVIDEASLVLRAVVADSEVNDTLRLEVEVRPAGAAFTGSATHSSQPVVSGATADVAVGSLDPQTSYRWQARTIDRGNRTSDWVAFGAGDVDFRVSVPRGPMTPANPAQMRADGSTDLGVGGTARETSVVLAATVDDPDEGATVRLEVEVRPLNVPFSGAATAQSAPVPRGQRARVTVSVTDDQAYHWQYRANDGTGRFSAWETYGGNGEDAPDFRVAIDDAPGTGASGQFQSDGSTPIAVGGTTTETSVVLAATPTDPDPGDVLRAQFELQPVGTAFTGTPTHTSATTASGTRATVTITVADGVQYHWQYRTIDQSNLATPWSQFGGNAADAADFSVAIPDPPAVPTATGQFRANGVTPIAQGGSTTEASVVFSGLMADTDLGASLRLEIELRPVGVAFSGSATNASAAVPAGTRASLAAVVTENTSYHWQYRAIDETGRASAWTPFGSNTEAEADFSVSAGTPAPSNPSAPSAGQFRADGTTAIAVGGSTDESSVTFASTLSDPDAGASLRLEIEVRPVGQALTGSPTHTSGAVGSGARASVSVAVTAGTQYHWAARAIDETNRTSSWVSFGGNADGAVDFSVAAAPPPPSPPGAPTALQQYRADGTTIIAVGDTTSESSVQLEAAVADPDGGALRLEIEVRPISVAFSNSATATLDNVASGTKGKITVAITTGGHHWQARACDATACGAWSAFGGNAETAADFVKP